jgi:hypothetical protein
MPVRDRLIAIGIDPEAERELHPVVDPPTHDSY